MTHDSSVTAIVAPPFWQRLQGVLERRPFLRDVAIMLGGSAGGQMISVALSPLLTRLYSPQQFGILSVYSALLAILVVVASLRYELALPLAKTDEDAVNLMAVGLAVLVLTTALFTAGAAAFPDEWLERVWPLPFNSAHVTPYRGMLSLGFFCLGGYYVALYFATHAGAFGSIARTRLAQGIVGPLSQIGLALLGGGAPALLVGSILGQSAGTFGLFYAVLGKKRGLLEALSWRRMLQLARRYCRFPLVGSWAALLDAAGGNHLLYLLVTVNYGARIAGFLFLAERILSRPLAIIGTSILQVFVGEAGRTASADPARLRRRFYQVVGRQTLLALLWIAAVNLGGALLFSDIFGAEWGDAVPYLQAMSPAYLALAVVLPVFHTLQLLEKQSLAATWQAGRLIFTVGLFVILSKAGVAPLWVVAGYGAAQAFCGALLLALMAWAVAKLQEVKP